MSYYDAYYAFEHMLVPSTFFGDKVKFVNALAKNGRQALFSGACAVLEDQGFKPPAPFTPEQFDARLFKYDDNTFVCKAVFPEPEEAALCYCAYMIFDPQFTDMMYFCAEKGEDLGEGPTCFLCGWLADGTHVNYSQCEPTDESAGTLALSIYFHLKEDK